MLLSDAITLVFKDLGGLREKLQTARGYERDARQFCLYVHNPTTENVHLTDIERYLRELEDVGFTRNGIQMKACALRKLFGALRRHGHYVVDPNSIPLHRREFKETTVATEDQIAAVQLEQRWGRITACRIVLNGPGRHHRKGGLYEVHIRLALPDGREVNVERTPPEDKRHSDLAFALNDAFKHARRQLEDQLRRTRGEVKHHEGPPIGTVVRLDPSGEFGFLEASDGEEIYFHRNSVLDDGFSRLTVGSRVTFAGIRR